MGERGKKAKQLSLETYGVSYLYFLFLDKKYQANFVQESSSYPYRLVEHYEKLHKLGGYEAAADKQDYVKKHYELYRKQLNWPDVEFHF
ncbi:hypothetical protein [Paenibacillus sp. IITD108]|uniref:hypothetical protein n=1 Tax=Paenibacillus sp. IITD108 TaxID=3116649 RepID=UPI002F42E42A